MLIPNKFNGFVHGRRLYLGGGKGGNAPPPDPRLIEANIRALDTQSGAIEQILANTQELLPIQREQMRFGLDAARTAYDQAQQDRGWILDRRGALSGVQDRLISDALSFDSEGRQRELAQQAATDVAQQFGLARGTLGRNMTAYGLDPNSGRFGASLAKMATDEALAKAGAINKTRQAARMEGFALTDRAANALAGYPAMGMQAANAGAGYGGMGLQLANTGLAGMNSGFGAAGSLAGSMANAATGMWGAQANYKAQQDATAASSDPFLTILGAAAGAGTAWGLGKFGK